MIDFSRVSSARLIGKLLRLPLAVIPRSAVVPILQGPARGLRWTVGASTHGCWLGSFEADKQRAIAAYVHPGSVAYDVGAHVGFYTLLLSRLVGQEGQVVAFEPLPRNVRYLRSHLRRNRITNVRILECAVSSSNGEGRFAGNESLHSEGRLVQNGDLTVPVSRLDTLVQSGTIPPPDCIKIDVEGAEAEVLKGGADVLARYKPIIFVATHGERVHEECVQTLRAHGYRLEKLGTQADELVALP